MDSWSCTDEVKELSRYIADYHDNLRASLADEQGEILDKLNDCQTELEDTQSVCCLLTPLNLA